jgi:hypothetical protein
MCALVTPAEYLQAIPPRIVFEPTRQLKSKSSGPRAHPKEPQKVATWDDFLPDPASFDFQPTETLLSPPAFTNYRVKVSDENMLQGVIRSNILNPLDELLHSLNWAMRFGGPSEIDRPVLKGLPDHVLHQNHELLSFMETKTVWDLHTPKDNKSIVEWWVEDTQAQSSELVNQNHRPSCYHIITQVYGYLSNHELKYGMLTNGEVVWFLCRPNIPDEPSLLLVSPPVSVVGQSPTLLQSMWHFISLVTHGRHHSGKSPATSPATGQLPQASSSIYPANIDKLPSDLDLSQLNERVGSGACGNVVKYVMYDGREVALKCCDTNNNKEGYGMMKKEVKVYKRLQALQGTVIPVLYFSGFYKDNNTFIIGTQLIHGRHPEEVGSHEAISRLKRKLAEYGVNHGDFRKENILVDENNHHWVIDFGKATFMYE